MNGTLYYDFLGSRYFPMPDVVEIWMPDGSRWDILSESLELRHMEGAFEMHKHQTLFRTRLTAPKPSELRDVVYNGWPVAAFRRVPTFPKGTIPTRMIDPEPGEPNA